MNPWLGTELTELIYSNCSYFFVDEHNTARILVLTAEENEEELMAFKTDITDSVKQSILSCEFIRIPEKITERFLTTTNDKIQKSIVLFILVSEAFVERCWPEVCKMKDLNSAFYDQNPLVVPVSIELGVRFPMGIKSAHNLAFHRRDPYYREALSKLLRQFLPRIL